MLGKGAVTGGGFQLFAVYTIYNLIARRHQILHTVCHGVTDITDRRGLYQSANIHYRLLLVENGCRLKKMALKSFNLSWGQLEFTALTGQWIAVITQGHSK